MRLYETTSKFTTAEFACKCGCGFGSEEKDINEDLIQKLNMLRTLIDQPMVVTSGARCADYNEIVGGLVDSAHLPHPETGQCRAVDIFVTGGITRYRIIDNAIKLGFKRIGIADSFIHLDVAWDLVKPAIFIY